MSETGSSIAASHLSVYAFLANDVPVSVIDYPDIEKGAIFNKGSRVLLTSFPRDELDDIDFIKFYSNEHKLYGACEPEDIRDFQTVVKSYITLRNLGAFPYDDEATVASEKEPNNRLFDADSTASSEEDHSAETVQHVIQADDAQSITSEQMAEMEAYYSQDPEYARTGNNNVLDADDLADMMSTTNMRLDDTAVENPINMAPITSTPAPFRQPNGQASVASKRQMADSTMLEREQLAHVEEKNQVTNVVNQGIGNVATGMQKYALKTDENIQRMGDLLSNQMSETKNHADAIAAMQVQMKSIASAVEPEKFVKTMTGLFEQLVDKHLQAQKSQAQSTQPTINMDTEPAAISERMTEPQTEKAAPKVKSIMKPKKGRRSARFILPDSDSDSDSEIADLIQNRTFDPQSSKMYCADAMFVDNSALAEDSLKSAENAMKRIRSNPDIVPKWSGSKGGLLSIFLCKDVFNFARKQGLLCEKYLKFWISYVFPSENEEKVYMYLNDIRNLFPDANLYKTLRALAFRMRPSEKTSIDALPKRQDNEGLLDLVLRLKIDIPICADVKEHEIIAKIVEFIRTHEKNETVKLEFKKAVLVYGRKITEKQLLKVAESLDELLETSRGRPTSRYQQVTAESSLYTDKEALEILLDNQKTLTDKIAALEQSRTKQINSNPKPKCQKCSAQPQKRKSGGFYPHCSDCFVNKVQVEYTSTSKRTVTSQTCKSCSRNTCNLNRFGKPFPTCYECFSKNQTGNTFGNMRNWSKVQASGQGN